MSGQAKDRRSKTDELLEGVPFNDIGDPTPLAAETPLTREAVIHLRAAAAEVGRTYGKVRSLLSTVDNALAEPLGGPKTLSEERRMDLAELVCLARDIAEKEMMEPVYERGRGERPHGDGPHLSLDEDEVRELALSINTICYITASVDKGDSRDLLAELMNEAALRSDKLLKEIEETVGADLYESTRDTASERAETIKREAREGVDAEPGTVTLSEEDVRRLNVLIAAVRVVCDGELGGYSGATQDRTPTGVRRVWKRVWGHVEPTVLKIEDAHPLDGDDLLNERGETLARLARESEEGES